MFPFSCLAVDYHVDSNSPYQNIGDVPWANLQPGDRVLIHWRNTPYKEKWVINAVGTEQDPIQVMNYWVVWL